MSRKPNILDFACDILFVKDPYVYPEEMWEELGILLEVYLSEKDLDSMGQSSEEEARKLRVDVLSELITSGVYFQMSDLVAANAKKEIFPQETPVPLDENVFIYSVLSSLGLNYAPETTGIFTFHAKIGEFPVYVWTSRELKMNVEMLKTLLDLALNSNYKHLYIVAPPQLTTKLPANISGTIPFNLLPAIYEDPLEEGETSVISEFID